MFTALAVLTAVVRLLPHPANFTPVGALGLFAGAHGRSRAALLVPLIALLAGDLLLGFYNPIIMAAVYGGFAVSVWIGHRFLRHSHASRRVAVSAVASSAAFFLLTNFACWLVGMYPRTLAGLGSCYAMGLPFFRNTLAGDLLYTAVLFGLYVLAQRRAAQRVAMDAASQ